MHYKISNTVRNRLIINNMMTVTTVELKNSGYHKFSSTLLIGTYSKEFIIH